MYSNLPNASLSNLPISNRFKHNGVSTFHEACDFIWKLPYGRTNHHGLIAVLSEGKGTCSSKHRLLKALVDELGIDGIELIAFFSGYLRSKIKSVKFQRIFNKISGSMLIGAGAVTATLHKSG
jgi:hypothetical protein